MSGISRVRDFSFQRATEADNRRSTSRAEVLNEIFEQVLAVLNTLPSPFAMDPDYVKLYFKACRGIRDFVDLEAVRLTLKSSCKYRPIPDELAEIVRKIVMGNAYRSEIAALPAPQRQAYRIVSAPRVEPGPNLIEAGSGREMARQYVRNLRGRNAPLSEITVHSQSTDVPYLLESDEVDKRRRMLREQGERLLRESGKVENH